MERFWNKVNKTEACWEWTAAIDPGGYGAFKVDGKKVNSHRFSWNLHFGSLPEGMLVCHTCDNRLCVRPDHLFLGSHQENHDDMVNKGRRFNKSKQEYCHLGHLMDPFNTSPSNGCRKCHNRRSREHMREKRSQPQISIRRK